MSKASSIPLALAVMVAMLGLSACGSDRVCEHDATDRVVSDSYCEKNTPGYEWDSGGGSHKTKTKRKKRS